MPKNFNKSNKWSWSATSYNKLNGTTTSSNGTSTYTAESGSFTGGGKGDMITGTPYSFGVRRIPPFEGSYSWSTSQTVESASGSFYGAPSNEGLFASNVTADMQECYDSAVSSLWDDIRGGVDLSVDAFQIRQTLDMIRRPMQSITQLANAIRKRSAKGGVDAFSSAWLETRYGWMPTLGTIYELAGRPGLSKDGRRHFRKSHHVNRTYELNSTIAIRGIPYPCKRKLTHECTSTVHCIINLDGASKAQKLSYYTSMNPLSIAWELLPYSFVVDWMYDIGGYLRSMESAMMYQSIVQKSWRSDLSVLKSDTHTTGTPDGSSGGYANVQGSNTLINFGRFNISGSPKPVAPVSNLNGLSWQRWTSAAALFSQAMLRK